MGNLITVYQALANSLDEQLISVENQLVNGAVKDWVEYREKVARRRAFKDAILTVGEVLKRSDEKDE